MRSGSFWEFQFVAGHGCDFTLWATWPKPPAVAFYRSSDGMWFDASML